MGGEPGQVDEKLARMQVEELLQEELRLLSSCSIDAAGENDNALPIQQIGKVNC